MLSYEQAMDAVHAGKVVRHARGGDRDLDRKIFRDPYAKEVKRTEITKHLVKVERNGSLEPYKIRPVDKTAQWEIVP